MSIEAVAINDLHPDPGNVRRHGERNLQAIKASLARFGQQKPIIVDMDNVIIAGNGTMEAAKALGWESLHVQRTDLTGAEAVAFAVADNRTAELASWDRAELAQTLEALRDDDAIQATGFSESEVADYIAELNGDLSALPDDAAGREYDESVADDVETCTCPECGGEVPL